MWFTQDCPLLNLMCNNSSEECRLIPWKKSKEISSFKIKIQISIYWKQFKDASHLHWLLIAMQTSTFFPILAFLCSKGSNFIYFFFRAGWMPKYCLWEQANTLSSSVLEWWSNYFEHLWEKSFSLMTSCTELKL